MSIKKTLTALVAGAALGAVAGVMLAPDSGDKIRKKVMKKASDLREQLTDLVGQGGSMMNDAKKASAEASKAVNDTMDEAKSSFENAKNSNVKA